MTTSFSKPSSFCVSLKIPQVTNFSSKFTYNYYVNDEGTNPQSGVPDEIKNKSSDLINAESTNLSIRIPRYVSLFWTPPSIVNQKNSQGISENLEKIVSEEKFLSSKYFPFFFSPKASIDHASQDVNSNSEAESQATTIDAYVNDLLKDYSTTGDVSGLNQLKSKIVSIVSTVESLSDNPGKAFGIKFYDESSNNQIQNYSGYDQLLTVNESVKSQINSLVLPDVFVSSSFSDTQILGINNSYNSTIYNSFNPNLNDDITTPVFIGPISPLNPVDETANVSFIGYVIDRFEILNTGPVHDRTIVIENPLSTKAVDTLVKYGSKYQYFIRTVVKIVIPEFDLNEVAIRDVTYFAMSSPVTALQVCDEAVPPPPPVDINFVWDYRRRKLNIVWGMPPNPQRDIKQFQIFRRKSINEPFELLKQQCFDFSTKKYLTGEDVDGNREDMTQEELSFVEYQQYPTMSFIDEGFVVSSEDLTSSKYIYTIASVDAHGFISNYGAQFEVTFDFYKNKLIKKLMSVKGAPRPYPNLLLRVDLFKDVIMTEGASSQKMKVYFMPEYYKVRYDNGLVTSLVGSAQQNAYYKMQFINTQNQKTDSLKIVVDDPYDLTKI
jgi:hypothetical protein